MLDPAAAKDLETMETLAPAIMKHIYTPDGGEDIRVNYRANLVFFTQPDLFLTNKSLTDLFAHGAIGVMIVSDYELPAGIEAIMTPTVVVKRKEKSMFTLDRTIALHPTNKPAKFNRGGMCCSLQHLLVFKLATSKMEVHFYKFLGSGSDDDVSDESKKKSKKKKEIIMVPQVWKTLPLSKPERKPFRDVKAGKHVPMSTFSQIIGHMYQMASETNTVLNNTIVQVGLGYGSLLMCCIKVSYCICGLF